MWYYIIKLIITVVLIVVISEVSKRSTFIGGLLVSLPTVSFFVFIWLYMDTRDAERVAALSKITFWWVLPSLALFIALPPLLLKAKLPFAPALAIATVIMFACYGVMVLALKRFGIEL